MTQLSNTLAGILIVTVALPAAAMSVSLTGNEAEPPSIGKIMTWTAGASDTGTIRYRFRVRRPGANFQMIRDYGPIASLDWAADREGPFEIEAAAKNLATGDSAKTSVTFHVASRVTGSDAAVNATSHPLVFLFSAPACAANGRMRVIFQTTAGGPEQQTPFKDCSPGRSMNFYLAGLHADTDYMAHAELDDARTISEGPALQFHSGSAPAFSFTQIPVIPAAPNQSQPVLLATTGGGQIATDLNGQVIWYNPNPPSYATDWESGGYMWGYIEDDTKPVEQQAIRKVDLLGQTVLETNAERLNEQLKAMGVPAISGLHHEVRTLPDGRIVALASIEKLLTNVQGPGTVDVLGDMILILDPNLQVLWTWNTFDHLDPSRKATLNEVCAPGGGGCSPFHLAPTANDWTHGNSVRQTPDGELLYSARHQDWLIKIAYGNGEGDGHIIWKLGKDGDFAFAGSSDPYPWFSHQHDANYETANRIEVFDNGNTRVVANGGGNSRGQVIHLDESTHVATLVLNADLGVFSQAVGSAQHLRNGNFHFDAGYVPTPSGLTSYALEVTPDGQIVSSIEAKTLLYRSIRLASLYSTN
jgi:hypothetical protein